MFEIVLSVVSVSLTTTTFASFRTGGSEKNALYYYNQNQHIPKIMFTLWLKSYTHDYRVIDVIDRFIKFHYHPIASRNTNNNNTPENGKNW